MILRVHLGSDHRGFNLKNLLKDFLTLRSHELMLPYSSIEVVDHGTDSNERVDYPEFAKRVCKALLSNNSKAQENGRPVDERGILICGSGVGMSIAANRFKGIYAALVCSSEQAAAARRDDMANVLVLPADFIHTDSIGQILKSWLLTKGPEGRYLRRLEMCDNLG